MQKKPTVNLEPPAGALITSLRSLGYTFDTAVADIIDNSISAGAKNIDVDINEDPHGDYIVSILDDGRGMSFDELAEAMALGSKSPVDERHADDLGRFGMGLKTASFSQAQKLTTISKTSDGFVNGLRWDLVQVAASNSWHADVVEGVWEAHGSKLVEKAMPRSGTLVIWSSCDRLLPTEKDNSHRRREVATKISNLKQFLSLTFHRYLTSGRKNKIAITVCGEALVPANPFCEGLKGADAPAAILVAPSQKLDPYQDVTVRGVVLPHPSTFRNVKELNQVAPRGDFLSSQGIYIYRGDRLISYGSWHRLAPKSQSNRLARLEINLPNSLDNEWVLDIKKSSITIPALCRNSLRKLVEKIRSTSSTVHTGRIRVAPRDKNASVWHRRYDAEKKLVTYCVNGNHQLVLELRSRLPDTSRSTLDALLALIESSIPVDLIENDIGATVSIGVEQIVDGELPEEIKSVISKLCMANVQGKLIVDAINSDTRFKEISDAAIVEYIKQYDKGSND